MLAADSTPTGVPASAHGPRRRQVTAPTPLRPRQVERPWPRPVGGRDVSPRLQDNLPAIGVRGKARLDPAGIEGRIGNQA
eukprot:1441194-Alexandrium_andersonii.AAC.1